MNLDHIGIIIAIIVGVYEVVVRSIPTVGNYSLLNTIIEILKKVSEFFNKKKK